APTDRPLLAITTGDPAGIGPEVTLKALAEGDVYSWCRPLVLGDTRILRRAMEATRLEQLGLRTVQIVNEAVFEPATVDVLDLHNADPRECPWGQITPAAGRAAVEYVLRGVDLALAGTVEAIVTAPLNKEAMQRAGFGWPGHTELLAERTGSGRVTMMLVNRELRVLHVSTHVSLHEAISRVTTTRVLEVVRLAEQGIRDLGIARPRIAVAGLNPHAGEHGLFGQEEIEIIGPAVEQARAAGLDVSGPLPPDTIFWRARRGEFDGVVAMYHDQGHIPMKLLGFDEGVNVSIGLPIIRTSVDHGTAFDIAGQGIA
ncbi:MAG TPA: 4-hydroxythreonine-4-phosphate dehydrogenase PdxA, partial [Herpetosiphonaceae bacterium]|nr:4-hydroxythreonine-4-phosphate dehydrogenase PdxA [Herpetosiphonaceae bacterium]